VRVLTIPVRIRGQAGAAAVERDYNVLLVEEPGLTGTLRLRPGLTLRPNDEVPVRAVVDCALGTAGVESGSRRARFLILCALTFLAANPVWAEPGDGLPDALAVLKRFSGAWRTATHIRHEGPPAREFYTQGEATCEQTLGGRYFEFRTQSIPPGQADLQVMTYDDKAGVYRQWLFDAEGYRHEAEGHWDAGRSTLRWKEKNADDPFVIEDHWISPDRLEWTLLRTDAQGRRVQSIRGTLLRK
jgi:hypothetical protein